MKLPKSPLISLISILWWLVLIAGSFFLGRSHGITLATPKYSIPTVQIDPTYQIPYNVLRPSKPQDSDYKNIVHWINILSKEDIEQYEKFVRTLDWALWEHRNIIIDCRLIQEPLDIDLFANAESMKTVIVNLLGVREHACSITPLLQMLEKASPVQNLSINLGNMRETEYHLSTDDRRLILALPTKKLEIANVIVGTDDYRYYTGGYLTQMQTYFQDSWFEEFTIRGVGAKYKGAVTIWSHFVPESYME